MDTNSTVTIAAIIAVVGFLITIYNFYNGRKKDTQAEDGKLEEIRTNLLKVNLKLDQVCTTTNETRTDIKSVNKQVQELDKEISVVKRDLQTAFVRIDELKEEFKHE